MTGPSEILSAIIDRGPCPLCASTERQIHIEFEPIPVCRCGKCGFLFTGSVIACKAMAGYYKTSFGGHRQLMGQEINAAVNVGIMERLLDLQTIKMFLDVGAGYGFLMQELRDRHNIDVKGVELSDQEVAFAKEQLGLDIRPKFLAEAGFQPASFDAVGCYETIEHIPEPIPFVRELAEYVKPGGVLVLKTDNFESNLVRKMGAAFPKWIPHAHVSDFTPETLRRCIEQVAGLFVEQVLTYTPWELHVLHLRHALRKPKSPNEYFNLEASLAREGGSEVPLYRFRRFTNALWARLTLSKRHTGAMIVAVARKT